MNFRMTGPSRSRTTGPSWIVAVLTRHLLLMSLNSFVSFLSDSHHDLSSFVCRKCIWFTKRMWILPIKLDVRMCSLGYALLLVVTFCQMLHNVTGTLVSLCKTFILFVLNKKYSVFKRCRQKRNKRPHSKSIWPSFDVNKPTCDDVMILTPNVTCLDLRPTV